MLATLVRVACLNIVVLILLLRCVERRATPEFTCDRNHDEVQSRYGDCVIETAIARLLPEELAEKAMKTLTICAHPNPKSFCHAVLEQFTGVWQTPVIRTR